MNSSLGEFQNRTLICSVLFFDIVEYSRKSVFEQGQLKDQFNKLLSQALRGVALNDRIILDTGDGAAISFIGDPEDALFVATGLRDVIASLAGDAGPELASRMGINLGPVRLVKDINGQPNVIGDGINVAQRVMTFARPGQVLVSRSYYEVVSRLSDESSKLFSYEGARTDKHIREHEVYAVGAIPGMRKRFDDSGAFDTTGEHRTGGLARASTAMRNAVGNLVRNPRVATAVAVVAILGVAVGARGYRSSEEPIGVPAAQVAASVPPLATEVAPSALPPIRGLPPEPAAPAAPAVQAAPEAPPEGASAPPERKAVPARADRKVREKPAPREQVAQREPPPPPPSEPGAAAPPAPAAVSFAIAPWGEVHVDGRMHGVSPPLQQLELTPGRHRIEIRNGGFPPHVVTVTAKPGERLRIKHKFN